MGHKERETGGHFHAPGRGLPQVDDRAHARRGGPVVLEKINNHARPRLHRKLTRWPFSCVHSLVHVVSAGLLPGLVSVHRQQ